MFFFFFAYNAISIGNAVIISYTWPVFAAIFGWLLLKEKMSLKNGLLLALAFAGIVLVYINKEFSFANKDFLGMGAMILSSAIYSLTVIIFKKESKHYSQYETVFFQNGRYSTD